MEESTLENIGKLKKLKIDETLQYLQFLENFYVKLNTDILEFETQEENNEIYEKYVKPHMGLDSIYTYFDINTTEGIDKAVATLNLTDIEKQELIANPYAFNTKVMDDLNTGIGAKIKQLRTERLITYVEKNQYLQQFMGITAEEFNVYVPNLDRGKPTDAGYAATPETVPVHNLSKYPKTDNWAKHLGGIKGLITKYPKFVYLRFIKYPVDTLYIRSLKDFDIIKISTVDIDIDTIAYNDYIEAYAHAKAQVLNKFYFPQMRENYEKYDVQMFMLICHAMNNIVPTMRLTSYTNREYTESEVKDILRTYNLGEILDYNFSASFFAKIARDIRTYENKAGDDNGVINEIIKTLELQSTATVNRVYLIREYLNTKLHDTVLKEGISRIDNVKINIVLQMIYPTNTTGVFINPVLVAPSGLNVQWDIGHKHYTDNKNLVPLITENIENQIKSTGRTVTKSRYVTLELLLANNNLDEVLRNTALFLLMSSPDLFNSKAQISMTDPMAYKVTLSELIYTYKMASKSLSLLPQASYKLNSKFDENYDLTHSFLLNVWDNQSITQRAQTTTVTVNGVTKTVYAILQEHYTPIEVKSLLYDVGVVNESNRVQFILQHGDKLYKKYTVVNYLRKLGVKSDELRSALDKLSDFYMVIKKSIPKSGFVAPAPASNDYNDFIKSNAPLHTYMTNLYTTYADKPIIEVKEKLQEVLVNVKDTLDLWLGSRGYTMPRNVFSPPKNNNQEIINVAQLLFDRFLTPYSKLMSTKTTITKGVNLPPGMFGGGVSGGDAGAGANSDVINDNDYIIHNMGPSSGALGVSTIESIVWLTDETAIESIESNKEVQVYQVSEPYIVIEHTAIQSALDVSIFSPAIEIIHDISNVIENNIVDNTQAYVEITNVFPPLKSTIIEK